MIRCDVESSLVIFFLKIFVFRKSVATRLGSRLVTTTRAITEKKHAGQSDDAGAARPGDGGDDDDGGGEEDVNGDGVQRRVAACAKGIRFWKVTADQIPDMTARR